MSRFYQPGANRAQAVSDLFATVAPRYDLINDLQSFGLHRLWKRRMIELARVQPGEKALDLCCGTGDVTFSLASRGLVTTGLDFSPAMLEVAHQRKRKRCPSGGVTFVQGDALDTRLPSAAFDIVTISYGLRNLASWEKGLEEMMRVANPGGRILVLDFGKPEHPMWRRGYLAYLRWAVPLFGRLFCGDADTHGYIHESLMSYPAQQGVRLHMERIGLTDCRIVPLLGGVMTINLGVRPR